MITEIYVVQFLSHFNHLYLFTCHLMLLGPK